MRRIMQAPLRKAAVGPGGSEHCCAREGNGFHVSLMPCAQDLLKSVAP